MKKIIFIFGIILGLVLLFFFTKEKTYNNKILINNQKFFVQIVSKPEDLVKGLSGREKLKENEGMLFVFEDLGNQGFWMKDMKFPIDIIWIKDNAIVGFQKNIDPQIGASESELKIYYPPENINKVLEVSSGVVNKYGFKIGDSISYN